MRSPSQNLVGKLRISHFCLMPPLIFLVLTVLLILTVTVKFIYEENLKASRLAAKLARGVIGEILIEDKIGLQIALDRMVDEYNLEEVLVLEKVKQCRFWQIGCACVQIETIEKKLFLYLRNTKGLLFSLIMGLSAIIVVSLIAIILMHRLLERMIATPTHMLIKQITGDIRSYIEQGTIIDADKYNFWISEFQSVADAQIELAKTLKKSLIEKQLIEVRSRTNAAIAQTTQMLAHDVRKPFSTLRIVIGFLEKADTLEETKKLIRLLRKDIDRSLTGVNGLLEDVMEVGRESQLETNDNSPRALLKSSLEEVARIYPEKDVDIQFNWDHQHNVTVNAQKIKRVFSNILENACQAMTNGESIWIKTTESKKFVTFTIRNTGGYIAKEDLPLIFDAFFTKSKKSGTGLGLAIAKKIVDAHGGIIDVDSDEIDKSVEFSVALPIGGTMDLIRVEFPGNLTAYGITADISH